jgi:DNA-binding transcriptional LysR family regulator
MPTTHDLSTGSLRVLVEVVRHGSFTGAARSLAYTQSAVSRQISALEADVGSPLFDRQARGVRLTDAGRRLLIHANAILDRLDAARNELADLRELHVGRLRLGAFATADASLIPQAVSTFKALHPGVQLSLHEGFSSELLQWLLGGQLDLAVISLPARAPAPAGVTGTKIVDDMMFVALPTDHRFVGRRRLRLADLADEDWIVGSSGAEDTLLSPLLRSGFSPRIGFDAMDWVAKQGFVAAGVGITLIPSLAIAAARPDVALVALDPRDVPARSVYAVTPADVTRSPATEVFLEVLAQHAAAHELP